MKISNILLYKRGSQIKKNYKEWVKEYFSGKTKAFKKPTRAKKLLNTWINKTIHKIMTNSSGDPPEETVEVDDISSDASIVLESLAIFKSPWHTSFDKESLSKKKKQSLRGHP